MGKEFLGQLKIYLSEMEKKRRFERLQENLKYAIERLDIETIQELLQYGASIEVLEKKHLVWESPLINTIPNYLGFLTGIERSN